MKRLLALIFLAGCAGLPSKYDNVLYSNIVNLTSNVETAKQNCGTKYFNVYIAAISGQSKELVVYTAYRSTDLATVLSLVNKDVAELATAYDDVIPSNEYCVLKLDIIDEELKMILKATGEKQ